MSFHEALSIEALIQLLVGLGFMGGAFYWGGQVKAMLCALKAGQEDHEHRLRTLEGTEQ